MQVISAVLVVASLLSWWPGVQVQLEYDHAFDMSGSDRAWLNAYDDKYSNQVDVYGVIVHRDPGDETTRNFVARVRGFGFAETLEILVTGSADGDAGCVGDRVHAWGKLSRVGMETFLLLPPRGGYTVFPKVLLARYYLLDRIERVLGHCEYGIP